MLSFLDLAMSGLTSLTFSDIDPCLIIRTQEETLQQHS